MVMGKIAVTTRIEDDGRAADAQRLATLTRSD